MGSPPPVFLAPLFIAPVFVAIAVALIIAGARKTQIRNDGLAQFALQEGFQIFPYGPDNSVPGGFWDLLVADRSQTPLGRTLARFAGFWPFAQGNNHTIRNLLYRNRDGMDVSAFDYRYQTTTSNMSNPTSITPNAQTTTTVTHVFGVVAVRIPVSLPPIQMAPENFMHRLGKHLGLTELEFEYEAFNQMYFVRSPDPKCAYEVLCPEVLQYFAALPVRHWQISGAQIVVAKEGILEAADIAEVIREIAGFVKLIPSFVKSDHPLYASWHDPGA
jgi:hypothetical protein